LNVEFVLVSLNAAAVLFRRSIEEVVVAFDAGSVIVA
jgi:hypothetical protein